VAGRDGQDVTAAAVTVTESRARQLERPFQRPRRSVTRRCVWACAAAPTWRAGPRAPGRRTCTCRRRHGHRLAAAVAASEPGPRSSSPATPGPGPVTRPAAPAGPAPAAPSGREDTEMRRLVEAEA
jgi:hypothetical protein